MHGTTQSEGASFQAWEYQSITSLSISRTVGNKVDFMEVYKKSQKVEKLATYNWRTGGLGR